MFSSLKIKIIFFIALIMAITAAAIMYFTHRDVGRAMFQAEEASAQNVLRLVELNIKGGYQKLLSDRIDTMLRRKNRLKNQAAIASSVLSQYAALSKRGLFSKQLAQKKAINWLKSVSFDKEKLAVLNQNSMIIAHPDPSIEGMSIASLRDMKGRSISKAMAYNVLKPEGDFAVFRWKNPGIETDKPGSKRLAYFLPFPKWRWTVVGVIDISDIEAEAQRELEKIIAVLRETFTKIQIAETGSVFLFDGKREMLIPPHGFQNQDNSSIRNSLTNNFLLDDLMDAAKSQNHSVRYVTSPLGSSSVMRAYVSYFKTLDWYIVVAVPVHEIQLPAKSMVARQSLIIAMIFFGSLIAASLLVAKISSPLNVLAAYAKELPTHDFTVEEEKEASPIDELLSKHKDEVGRLAESFKFMKAELKKNIKNLMETTAAKERIQSELNVAREIQLGFLPKTFPPFPEYKDFDLYATLESAKEVGGDLYDFFFIDDDHICFTLGDVSDKGVPASLFMVITRTLIKAVAQQDLSPADMMFQINNTLSADNPKTMFVTLIIGILNVRTGEVRYANGGHNPPIVVSQKEGVFYQEGISGPLLGPIENVPYKELSLTLQPGDCLFLYTDGVTESMDSEKNLFSDERLLAEIETLRNGDVEDIVNGIITSIKEHVKSEPQSDDIAMMMLKYNGDRG